MKTNIKKTIDFVLIIMVFAITGSSTAFLSGIIMNAVGAEPWTFGFVAGYLFLIFPLYQALTLVFAFIFGKFSWFYSRQRKTVIKTVELFKRAIGKNPVSETE
ncbi:MAG: hypothetical protein JW995_08265 [Melioribacteraceae bacterium]|nr:hypothetical protein [Melioribacteraceae bacterium]